jgi:D-alanyl-D-alanine carboxypeptidase
MLSVLALLLAYGVQTAPPPIDAEKLAARIDALGRQALEEDHVPALTVAVAQKHEIVVAKGFGYVDAEHTIAATRDTRYAIGSLTRQFTAVSVLQLIDAKKLALDDQLTRLLPEFPDQKRPITLQQLLANTSGVPGYRALLAKHPELETKRLSEKEFLALFADVPFAFEPGAGFALDSAGYVLLALIVRRRAETGFTEYVRTQLLEPLALEQTDFCALKDPPLGFGVDCKQPFAGRELELPGTAPATVATQSLCSSVNDLIRWQRALVDRAVFSERASRMIMTPARLPDGSSTNYGFALGMGRIGEFKLYAHTGGGGGSRVRLAYYSQPEVTICVLANCSGAPVERIEKELARHILGLATPESFDHKLTPEQSALYAGMYQLASTRIRIFERDGSLWYEAPEGPPARLKHQGEHAFVFARDVDEKLSFDVDEARTLGFTLTRAGFQSQAKRVEK